ncbi:uncharacterized protein LOC122540526 isoform X1 [Chiloscyllium plagiosum]|uniref:uncharacterized protein LOC122540526 isoform X1 n=1 Tax=Chiloscyllium plagiosum TaxID=36176 RepID=UPI001CB7FE92|nr:uncharacterized protein LOC122540526 isoform X1 [Chiloscyllium plagiosum]
MITLFPVSVTMDVLEYLISRQGLFGMVTDFFVSTMTLTLLSVISLLTYFDILESFRPFRWLCKVTIQDKQYTQEGDNGKTGVQLDTGAKGQSPVQRLWSVAEWVKQLELELCTDTTDQCCAPKYRRTFVKQHQEICRLSHLLQSLGGQSAGAEGQSETFRNYELSRGTFSHRFSPEGSTEQNNAKVDNMVTARDRGRIQVLSSKLQTLKMYTKERLQLLNSFAGCYESYRLSYDELHHWVMRTSRFEEWVHSLACDSESLIITNLNHQKRIVDEVEQRAPQLSSCQENLRECVRVFKQLELQAALFNASFEPKRVLHVKAHQVATFPCSVHEEFDGLKQQFITILRLTRCYVIHLRDLLRIRHQKNLFPLSARDSVGLIAPLRDTPL